MIARRGRSAITRRIVILVNALSPRVCVVAKRIVALMGMCAPAAILIALVFTVPIVTMRAFVREKKLASNKVARVPEIHVLVARPIVMKSMIAVMQP